MAGPSAGQWFMVKVKAMNCGKSKRMEWMERGEGREVDEDGEERTSATNVLNSNVDFIQN